jgi:hypothetical protein
LTGRLLPSQGILRTIALSGVPDGGVDAGEVLRLALDAAAEGGGAEDPLVVASAHLVIEVEPTARLDGQEDNACGTTFA